jgi:hypothetical protein
MRQPRPRRRLSRLARPAPLATRRKSHRRPHPLREIALILALFLAYKAGRLLVVGDVREATANGHRVWDAERWLDLPDEQHVQAWLLQSHELTRLANEFYALVHFPATAAFLLWMWLWRPAFYLGARRSLAVVTALALVIHAVFPLAPPRLVPGLGLVDTGALVGPAVYGNPRTDTLTNQFAAMPSLHIGWAIILAVVLVRATRSRWRWLWVMHPAITTLVVVATANHYWADGVAAALLAAAAVVVVMVPTDRATRPATPVAPPSDLDGAARPPQWPHEDARPTSLSDDAEPIP